MKNKLFILNHFSQIILGSSLFFLSGCFFNSSSGTAQTSSSESTSTSAPIETTYVTTATNNYEYTLGKNLETLSSGSVEREFIVHVPANIDNTKPVPVVFMLHGTTGSGDVMYNSSGWVKKSEQENIISVYPSALYYCYGEDDIQINGVIDANEWRITTKWNANCLGVDYRPLCPSSVIAKLPAAKRRMLKTLEVNKSGQYVQDLKKEEDFFRSMIETLKTKYPVDETRFYISGFSNGGEMSSFLSVAMSDVFSAAAANGGSSREITTTAAQPIPVIFAVGSVDHRFLEWSLNPETTTLGSPQFNQSCASLDPLVSLYIPSECNLHEFPLDSSVLDQGIMQAMNSKFTTGQGIDFSNPTSDMIQLNGVDVGRFSSDISTIGGDNSYTMLILDNVDHVYPNGDDKSPIIMADYLWDFFKQYHK